MSDSPTDFQLLHEDPALLVLEKPAGMLSVPGRGADKQDCLSARAQRRWPDALVVHRLDMATSGIVVFARGILAQRSLGLAFAQREVGKRYEAVVDGSLAAPAGDSQAWSTIDLPIAADWPRRPLRTIDPEAGKPSQTRWRVLAQMHDARGESTRLALEPLTGRTHQLRVHLQAIGHPILGDALYASPAVQARSARLLLHACRLELRHPASSQTVAWESPAPF